MIMTYKQFNIAIWFLRITAAVILLQTLSFKFSAAPESVYIFSTLGIEPWGRIATGIAELVASLLILFPRTTGIGALLSLGVMAGALVSHVAWLGIAVQDDGGLLFILALVVFVASAILLVLFRNQVYRLIPFKH